MSVVPHSHGPWSEGSQPDLCPVCQRPMRLDPIDAVWPAVMELRKQFFDEMAALNRRGRKEA